MNIKIGHSYDVHQLVEGRKLILGGIELEYHKGLLGHSDADVLTHAIIESIIGALGKGDIGTLFPDTDVKYKDADSMELLIDVLKIMKSEKYVINNIDATVYMENPKLNPHIPEMCQIIAEILRVDIDAVSIKATTHELVDSFGERRAIKAYSSCLLQK